MCGRARCTLSADGFLRACHLNGRPIRHLNMNGYVPSYNVAPGFNVPVVRREEAGDGDGVVLHCMKWGLIPSFSNKTEKPDHFRMFNARSESIREKASFRRLLPSNRCLVSVEGFYEWKKDGSRKQPYYIYFKDGRPLVFAALFDSWKNLEGEIIYTFTIITTSSSSSLEWLHDRMPVVLGNQESTESWLNDSSSSNFEKILKPYEETNLAWYPVTPTMGKLSCNGPECIKEAVLKGNPAYSPHMQVKTEETKSISQFFSKKVHGSEPKLEKTTIVEEAKIGQPKHIKEEPENELSVENTRLKHEPGEANKLKHMKEEPEPPNDVYHHSISMKDDDSIKSDVSPMPSKGVFTDTALKRDYEGLSASAKPFIKETIRQDISSARKRSKGLTDKQPTLFSYFGRS